MKVKELIEKLKAQNPEADVIGFADGDEIVDVYVQETFEQVGGKVYKSPVLLDSATEAERELSSIAEQ